MKLLTERAQVRTAAERFEKDAWGADKSEKLDKLKSIDKETATADDISAIVGSHNFASPTRCMECETLKWEIIELGEEFNIDTNTVWICTDCLRNALAILEGAE